MSVPDYQSFMRPLLEYAADGSEKNIREAIDALAEKMGLWEEDRTKLLPSGKKTFLSDRVHWARTYLDKAGAIKRTRRAHFEITDRGKKLLQEHPDTIDNSVLKHFPEFIAFLSPSHEDDVEAQSASTELADAATPEDAIYDAQKQISKDLASKLLSRIQELSPAFFERLVVDLIVAMGYGGSRATVAMRIGQSGDGGIDRLVNEDPLGLDVVYIQAKRYAKDNPIGPDLIQQFAGALLKRGATKGVFVTTSRFTVGAIEYAKQLATHRIILIDGDQLAKLMIQYNVGVRPEQSVEIKRIDVDYFDENEE
jgi:restriction system protein